MHMIRISETKLKVILSRSDLQKLDISVESMDYANVSTKRVFWEILDEARHTTGFDAESAKLFVQVFPDAEGGCEMFITKEREITQQDAAFTRKKVYRLAAVSDETAGEYVRLDFDALCKLCKRMKREGVRNITDLYYDGEDGYILSVLQKLRLPAYISATTRMICGIPPWLSEYGKTGTLDARLAAYLSEHYEKLASENAVELIAKL